MKLRQVGAEFHADRRTDRHDEDVSGNFANAPEKHCDDYCVPNISLNRCNHTFYGLCGS